MGSNSAFGTSTITLNGGNMNVPSGLTLNNTLDLISGTLSGTGTIGSGVTLGNNLIVSPGNSPGNLTFTSGLTLSFGGEYDWQIQSVADAPLLGAGTNWDLITVSGGTLDLSLLTPGSFTIKLFSLNSSGAAGAVSDFDPSLDYSWTIMTTASGITGTFDAANFNLDTSGFTNPLNPGGHFFLTQTDNDLTMNFAAVPEPSTYALLTLGLSAMLLPALRRQR